MTEKKISIPKEKFLIIGCGSIGKRHLKNLQDLGVKEIIAFDTNKQRCSEIKKNYHIDVYDNLEEAIKENVSVTIICSPTSYHRAHIQKSVNANCHIFVEKPIAESLKNMESLLDEIKSRSLISLVGCNFRFHPGLQKVKSLLDENAIGKIISARAQFGQYLPDWHPWEDYRNTYSAKKELGGGVLLDRIHEIDYIRWLLGDVVEVFAVLQHLSSLEIDTEDVAELILTFSKGHIASIHLDYIRRIYDCGLEIIGEEGIIQWSYQDHCVHWYVAAQKKWNRIQWTNYEPNQMYLDEMRHFIELLNHHETAQLPADEGVKVLEIALAAKKSAQKHKPVIL
jgi:predicted dehydrogenase